GLPQKGAYETVLRDALCTDELDPPGIYFGTRSGQLFGSRDEGRSWEKIVEGFPSILCVRCAVADDFSSQMMPTRSQRTAAPLGPRTKGKSRSTKRRSSK